MGLLYSSRSNSRRVKGSEVRSSGSVQVDGVSVYYETAGLAELGPTVLFLHDGGGTAATWQAQLVGVSQSARCIAMDLPGHGRSEGVGAASIGEYRQRVLDFLDALAIRWPVVVVGVCLGASIAVDLALAAPERVAGLILSGVSEGGRTCAAATREEISRGDAAPAFVMDLFSETASRQVISAQMTRWRNTSPTVRYGDLMAQSEYSVVDSLREVAHPVLLVAGERDATASPAVTFAVADQMTDARAAVVPGAGCLCMVEHPNAYNRIVSDFLHGRLRPTSPVIPDQERRGGYRRF